MNQKTALTMALGLTTFILVAVGSIALAWPAIQQSGQPETQPVIQEIPAQSAETQALVDPAASSASGDVQTLMAAIEARDAAYQAQIEQANQQLKDAYQQIEALKAQNQLLLEREQIYQQRLQESARIIEAMSAPQSTVAVNAPYDDDHNDHDGYYEQEDHDEHDGYEKDDD